MSVDSIKKMLNNIQRQNQITNALLFKQRGNRQNYKKKIVNSNSMGYFPDPSKAYAWDASDIQKLSRTKYQSLVYEYSEKAISGELILMNERTEGVISEIYFLSENSPATNKAYSVQIRADGNQIYNGTWTEFEARHGYEDDLTCEDDGTYFVLNLKSIFYLETIEIRIYDSSATFKKIHIKALQRLPQQLKT